ncbi:EFR1 family ferrodoxin [Sinanaerobacter chloroacetimidivorans]|jgi:ferredoxin/flavodoxin|uniref:EFR1 family ferrodoxin n=1 Tax=Sinanaerobacter chloroacetimidivorans TaxID=2818044 RepID=A0A8J8AZV1_9FIRM|nr:EFR1 family ferrodoxin [Sinanaerobacter chloroacetimidivorans]MBR0596918.1 EFR1 family ferrodoxin [Sinanaerobacter chloroacetimidivorans]
MNVNAVYFSPTETTKKIVEGIAQKIVRILSENTYYINDFTLKNARDEALSFHEKDLVIVGVPVYAGRVPNVLLNYLNSMRGNGAMAVCVVVYGNRNYDDALIELRDIIKEDGFQVIAAGAFVGEHSFSKILAMGRPDEKDMAVVDRFADQICKKLAEGSVHDTITVQGNEPYRKYYMPRDKAGNPVDIRKVTPRTNINCKNCRICANICPMGSIDPVQPSKLNGICIKCGACIKKCPFGAKYYDDPDYLRHQYELEEEFSDRREPELFI